MTRASHCLSAYFSGVGSVRETTLTAKSSDIPFAFTLASEDGDALFTGVESASAWIGGFLPGERDLAASSAGVESWVTQVNSRAKARELRFAKRQESTIVVQRPPLSTLAL